MNPICPYPGAKASIAFLTVQRCEELLGSNVAHQRKVSHHNITKIQDDMSHDRFHLSGESVIVGKSGKLLDGQHRVLAALNIKKGFWTVIVEGIDDELFHLINIGKSRSLADVLHIAGEKNAANLATSLNRLVEYMRSAQSVGSAAPVSVSEAMDTLAIMPTIRESVSYCGGNLAKVCSLSRTAWLHCITTEACPEQAKIFFSKLASGELLPASSPIYLLRARMVAERQARSKLPLREVLALIVKAWNAHIENKQLKLLKWGSEEAFPEIVLPNKKAKAA